MVHIATRLASIALGLTFAYAAQAQTNAEITEGANWQHTRSELSFPTQIGNFKRQAVTLYDKDGFNVAGSYFEQKSKTIATIYLYRTGVHSLPIWADRAATSMLSNPQLGKIDLDHTTFGAFVPPNSGGVASGFKLVAPVSGHELKSSALALFAHNDWILKVRVSSETLGQDELDATVVDLLGRTPLGKNDVVPRPFVAMEDCSEPLEIDKDAKIVRLDLVSALLVSTALGAASEKAASSSQTENITWCRDSVGQQFATYRANETKEGYLIAFGDSGYVASVGHYDLGRLIRPSRGYMVSLSDGITREVLPPFNRLPKIEQTAGLPGQVSPVIVVDLRPENTGKQTIIIPAD